MNQTYNSVELYNFACMTVLNRLEKRKATLEKWKVDAETTETVVNLLNDYNNMLISTRSILSLDTSLPENHCKTIRKIKKLLSQLSITVNVFDNNNRKYHIHDMKTSTEINACRIVIDFMKDIIKYPKNMWASLILDESSLYTVKRVGKMTEFELTQLKDVYHETVNEILDIVHTCTTFLTFNTITEDEKDLAACEYAINVFMDYIEFTYNFFKSPTDKAFLNYIRTVLIEHDADHDKYRIVYDLILSMSSLLLYDIENPNTPEIPDKETAKELLYRTDQYKNILTKKRNEALEKFKSEYKCKIVK